MKRSCIILRGGSRDASQDVSRYEAFLHNITRQFVRSFARRSANEVFLHTHTKRFAEQCEYNCEYLLWKVVSVDFRKDFAFLFNRVWSIGML